MANVTLSSFKTDLPNLLGQIPLLHMPIENLRNYQNCWTMGSMYVGFTSVRTATGLDLERAGSILLYAHPSQCNILYLAHWANTLNKTFNSEIYCTPILDLWKTSRTYFLITFDQRTQREALPGRKRQNYFSTPF